MELTCSVLYTTPNGTLSAFLETPRVKKKEKINKQRNSIKTEVWVKAVRRGMDGSEHVLF
jgi:hypothetical protein